MCLDLSTSKGQRYKQLLFLALSTSKVEIEGLLHGYTFPQGQLGRYNVLSKSDHPVVLLPTVVPLWQKGTVSDKPENKRQQRINYYIYFCIIHIERQIK